MEIVSKNTLTIKIIEFVSTSGCCLFAGAGVGMRANLPSWKEYLEHLANVACSYEEETATLMRKRISTEHYSLAAHLYKTCVAIPKGEMYRQLSSPFTENEDYNPRSLYSLMTLPFCAAVTTNYDYCLHDSYSALYKIQKESGLTLTAPQHVELGDPSMKQAIFWKKFFIARIHGRAEVPETIVIDSDDYKNLAQDVNYQDFLFNILTRYHCLFIGYSFLDPAISKIFELIEEKVPPPYNKLHVALLPSDSDSKLISRLLKYNIETIIYDPSDNHKALWDAIKMAQKEIRTNPRVAPERFESIKGLGRFIASTYSRMKVRDAPEPLIQIVIEGVVAQAIIDNGPKGSDKDSLIQSIKKIFGLPNKQLEFLITKAADGLMNKGLCTENDNRLVCVPGRENKFDSAMRTLIHGVCNRLKVREGIDATSQNKIVIEKILNKLFLSRGWDLGAHFAGGRSSDTFDAWDQIKYYILQLSENSAAHNLSLSNAIFDLFRHPENKEAELLTDIGRISFGIELALNNAQSVASETFMLPKTIYFDSNVLMPAIVKGHPFSPVYTDAINRLQIASASSGNRVQIFISSDFLNEIINHRRIAIEQVNYLGLDNPEKLKRHILLMGADGTNVFIGAYSSWVAMKRREVSFSKFLIEVAPYANEERLSKYLETKGIRTVHHSFTDTKEQGQYFSIKNELHDAYETQYPLTEYSKAGILIDHEAAQLTRLIIDIEKGRSPIFVTADKRLMSLCKGPNLGKCTNSVVSHLGFIQIIDLVLGLDTKPVALSRLVWSIGYTDDEAVIRNYMIDLALQGYDDAMTRAMWEVIDEISEKISSQAKDENIKLFSRDVNERILTTAFLDRFEEGFFEKMAAVIKKSELLERN